MHRNAAGNGANIWHGSVQNVASCSFAGDLEKEGAWYKVADNGDKGRACNLGNVFDAGDGNHDCESRNVEERGAEDLCSQWRLCRLVVLLLHVRCCRAAAAQIK